MRGEGGSNAKIGAGEVSRRAASSADIEACGDDELWRAEQEDGEEVMRRLELARSVAGRSLVQM